MKEIQFIEYTIVSEGSEQHRAIFKASTGEEISIVLVPETQELIASYIDNLMRGKPTLIEEEKQENNSLSKKLLTYSRSYLDRGAQGDAQEALHITTAEEYLALSLMMERFELWAVDPRPILKKAMNHYKDPFDITRYNVVTHCLSMLNDNNSENE